jgi:hypothetical protein
MRICTAVGLVCVALVACGSGPNRSATQTRAVELGQIATLTAPTPTRAAGVAATVALGSAPYTGQRWDGHPIPGNPRVVETQPGRISLGLRGSQQDVVALYERTWSGDGYLIVSSEQKGDLRVVTAHKITKTLIAVFSAPSSSGEVLFTIDDTQ